MARAIPVEDEAPNSRDSQRVPNGGIVSLDAANRTPTVTT
jgi:hypothetical protein